jgi:hypothetical protein
MKERIMKSMLACTAAFLLTLLGPVTASAELRRVDLRILGMD